MIILCIVFGVLLHKKKLLHVTFRLFVASVVLEFVSFLIYMIHCIQFSQTGEFVGPVLTVSRIFDTVAQIIFLLMLILVSKGYTITRGKLRTVTKVKITIFFLIYSLAFIGAFIYAEVVIYWKTSTNFKFINQIVY